GALPFNATAAQVQTALNLLPSIGGVGGAVTVSPVPAVAEIQGITLTGATAGTTQFRLTFNGQQTAPIAFGGTSEVQTITLTNATPAPPPNGTQFTLSFGGNTTTTLTYTGNPADATAIQT